MAQNRGTKWYRKNEAEVMDRLGLTPTINSGSTWIEKGDGQSEEVICELKSTDANSYRINKSDLDTLEYNSMVVHKLPVFAIQFLKTDELYLMVKPEYLLDLAKYIKTGEVREKPEELVKDVKPRKPKKQVKSSKAAREEFYKEQAERYNKIKEAT